MTSDGKLEIPDEAFDEVVEFLDFLGDDMSEILRETSGRLRRYASREEDLRGKTRLVINREDAVQAVFGDELGEEEIRRRIDEAVTGAGDLTPGDGSAGPPQVEWYLDSGSRYSKTHLVKNFSPTGRHELFCGRNANKDATESRGHREFCAGCKAKYREWLMDKREERKTSP